MLRVDPDKQREMPQRSQRFPSAVLDRVNSFVAKDSFAAQEMEAPLWEALSIAFAESLQAEAEAAAAALAHQASGSQISAGASLGSVVAGAPSSVQLSAGPHADSRGLQGRQSIPLSGPEARLEEGLDGHSGAVSLELPLPSEQSKAATVPERTGKGHSVTESITTQHGGLTEGCATDHDDAEGGPITTSPPGHTTSSDGVTPAPSESAHQSRRPGFDALHRLLKHKFTPEGVRCQSARPADGGKRGGAGVRRRRWASGWEAEAAARLRWSYDGGVGYGVPALGLHELLELEAQTRQAAKASVQEFAEAKRRQESLEADLVRLQSSVR